MTQAPLQVYKQLMTVLSPSELTATATPADDGVRLDVFLSGAFDGLSRSRVQALVKAAGCRTGNDVITDPKHKVRAGKIYVLSLPAPAPATPQPQDIALDILFEDADLLVVNKPAGMAVHPAPGSPDGTLVNALLHHCRGQLPGIGGVERPGIVHRIDKHTTGVMVVAKTEAAHHGLSALFAAHDIDRAYLALTRGAPRPLSGTVDAPLARSLTDRKKIAVVKPDETRGGRHAVTHYKALKTYGRISKVEQRPAAALIECRLETGRTHQIRVHMSHLGTPLIGDPVYGRHKGIKSAGSGADFETAMQTIRSLERQALHAASLGFDHPVTGKAVYAEAQLPPDMAQTVMALETL